MGNSHSSFTYEDRVMIQVMLKAKKTQTEIAAELGKTRSAVCQEIHRHAMWKDSPIPLKPDYRAAEAQYQAEQGLRKRGRKRTKLTKREEGIILTHLELGWSPEQIVHNKLHDKMCVHTLYNLINYHQIPGVDPKKHLINGQKQFIRRLNRSLKSPHKQRMSDLASRKRTNDNRINYPKMAEKFPKIRTLSIEQRPETINSRQQFGHFELDGVESSKSKALVLTLIERKTRMLFAIVIPNKQAATVAKALDDFLYTYGDIVRTITSDNGKEFVNRPVEGILTKYQVKHYLAHPYSAYERGTNENFNRVLRRHFPKGTDFSKVTQAQLSEACQKINQRPLMMFNFKTTAEKNFNSALNRSRGHRKSS